MNNISIIGDNGNIKETILNLFSKNKLEISEQFLDKEILIAHSNSPAKHITHTAIINSDEKQTLSTVENANTIITYGLNPRACVTASSLSKDTIQICIQRTIPSPNGHLEAQEFTMPIPPNKTPQEILAATTAALICGIQPDKIQL